MSVVFEKISNGTLRGRIAEKIEEAILNGFLREGERLVERKLAAEFETSLTAVREALIELEGNGFVTKKPNAATYVTRSSPEAAQKVFVLRRLLEGFAVQEAARLATPQQVEKLERTYWEFLDAARSKDARLYLQRDLAFHEVIWQTAGNEYIHDTLRRSLLPFFAFTAIRIVSHPPFDLLQDAQSHYPLLEAIKSKDPEAAQKAFEVACAEWLSKTQSYVVGEDTSHPELKV